MDAPFERQSPPGTPRAGFHGTWLARVVDTNDSDGLNRVQVRLLAVDGLDDHDAPVWARVATAFAGNNYGAVFIPKVDEEVLVTFIQGDPRFPVVVGSLWNGGAQPPETLGSNVDRWILVGANGSRIAIVEEQASTATITLETPAGVKLELTDSGTKATIDAQGSTITVEPSGITLETGATVTVNASRVSVSAGQVSVDSAMSTFSGVVQCNTLIATTVVGTTYTPGAGNIW